MTAEEYLEFEKTSDIRHEFVDGVLRAMAGESRRHNDIVLNLVEALRPVARAKQCALHATNIKTRVSSSKYRYPDVVISCAPGNDEYFLENPCFIVEVLSDSTADVDHDRKLEEYTRLPSMGRYLLESQIERRVIVYKRDNGVWTLEILTESGEVDIPFLETTLSLEQVYAGLE
jgi:Uma2 family endonuclease